MEKLLEKVEELKRGGIGRIVDSRIAEFKELGGKSSSELFKELCFCLMTANCGAQICIDIQAAIGNGFLNLDKDSLADRLSSLGYRYPNKRAEYIAEARKYKDSLKEIIDSFSDEKSLRQWLTDNIKGLGFKEASHFLRNIGYDNMAIIDRHIINILVGHGLIERPKTITRKRYLEIESLLKKIAEKSGLTLAELDLYLWYIQTGKVLK